MDLIKELNSLGLSKCRFRRSTIDTGKYLRFKRKWERKAVPTVCEFTASKDGEVYCVVDGVVNIKELKRCNKPKRKEEYVKIESEPLF
jgi:hypothetical protein